MLSGQDTLSIVATPVSAAAHSSVFAVSCCAALCPYPSFVSAKYSLEGVSIVELQDVKQKLITKAYQTFPDA